MDSTSIRYHQLFGAVLSRVPEFLPVYRGHLMEYDDDNPKILMTELAHLLLRALEEREAAQPAAAGGDVAMRIFEAIDPYVNGHDDVRRLVAESFIAPLKDAGVPLASVSAFMGAALLAELGLD